MPVDLPADAKDLISKMLEVSPEKRITVRPSILSGRLLEIDPETAIRRWHKFKLTLG
jgi:hypothetical protein